MKTARASNATLPKPKQNQTECASALTKLGVTKVLLRRAPTKNVHFLLKISHKQGSRYSRDLRHPRDSKRINYAHNKLPIDPDNFKFEHLQRIS